MYRSFVVLRASSASVSFLIAFSMLKIELRGFELTCIATINPRHALQTRKFSQFEAVRRDFTTDFRQFVLKKLPPALSLLNNLPELERLQVRFVSAFEAFIANSFFLGALFSFGFSRNFCSLKF